MKFKKGDSAVMINCGEAEHYAGKVWTCKDDCFKDNNNEEVVFLEGFSGYFHCRFLVKPYQEGVDSNSIGIEQMDLMLATGALQVTIEIGISRGYPMEDEKSALSRLKAALGVTA